MATERSRSPLELPPRKSGKERLEARADEELESSARVRASVRARVPITSMPISFGVLVLGLTVSCLLCLLLSGVAYRSVSARAQEASRASQRLGKELSHFKAVAAALQNQLDVRAQDISGQALEIERLSAELKTLRGRGGADGRSARLHRDAR